MGGHDDKAKTSTKLVVHSPIGSFGRGVQLSPISTSQAACELASQAASFCYQHYQIFMESLYRCSTNQDSRETASPACSQDPGA